MLTRHPEDCIRRVEIENLLTAAFGASVDKIHVSNTTCFNVGEYDLRPLMRLCGGEWAALVDKVEMEQAARKDKTKFFDEELFDKQRNESLEKTRQLQRELELKHKKERAVDVDKTPIMANRILSDRVATLADVPTIDSIAGNAKLVDRAS